MSRLKQPFSSPSPQSTDLPAFSSLPFPSPNSLHKPLDCPQGKAGEESREPSQLDLLLARLPACVSKELADELAVNFCYCQNKGARRRLVRALTAEMPVVALGLLPYYSRIAATLAQVFPDVAQGE